MSNQKLTLIPDPAVEILNILSNVQAVTCSEEGLKEIWQKTTQRIKIMLGNHEAMANYMTANINLFRKLDPERYVRTVTPKDLQLAMNALERLNIVLAETRSGKPVDLKEAADQDMTNAGVEYREDGKLYADKFENGNWGEGKGKTNLNTPMTFKRKIDEFGWDTQAPRFVTDFINLLKRVNKNSVITSVDNHYKDLDRAAYSRHEKADLRLDKRVALNQIRNILVVRNVVAKFIFKTLETVMRAVKLEDIAHTETVTGSGEGGDWEVTNV